MTDKKAKGREGTGRDWLIRAAITLFVIGAVAGYAYYDLALRTRPQIISESAKAGLEQMPIGMHGARMAADQSSPCR